ncbi:MAG: hypothetical protein MJ016_02615, partial [Victivallaceae bacterium]|nr:hypothetical protein [Victivallaceae bacterium]
RLAALELPGNVKRTPLNALSAEKLRERGVQQLFLFKASGFGKDSAPLGDRCALDMQGPTPALIVRNTARGAMELKAQIGDFVLSSEGDFVGIIVSVTENGRFQEARAVLCDESIWENSRSISLTPDPNGIYRDFSDFMRKVIER